MALDTFRRRNKKAHRCLLPVVRKRNDWRYVRMALRVFGSDVMLDKLRMNAEYGSSVDQLIDT